MNRRRAKNKEASAMGVAEASNYHQPTTKGDAMNSSIISDQTCNFDNKLAMTSLEIAELVESRHDKVRQSIERLAKRGVIQLPPMGEVENNQSLSPNRASRLYIFEGEQGKRDSYVVVAQLCPEFTARLVDRWQELEAGNSLPDFNNPVIAARAWADAKESEQKAVAQRDQAIATKAQISSSREASVMGKLSAVSRKVQKLEQELGRNTTEATVTAVEKAMGQKYGKQGFRPLKKWCKDNCVTPSKVPCPRYGEVVAWPAAAWLYCYGVDLHALFGREDAA